MNPAEPAPYIHFESIRRWADNGHAVSVSIVRGHVKSVLAGTLGHGAPVRFRLLHAFETHDGLITYNSAWLHEGIGRRKLVRS